MQVQITINRQDVENIIKDYFIRKELSPIKNIYPIIDDISLPYDKTGKAFSGYIIYMEDK